MSFGLLSRPALENVSSTVIHLGILDIGGTGPAFIGEGGSIGSTKKCIDIHSRYIPQGVHYVPGPDECTVCSCDDGLPKWCKAVMCSPPSGCQSFRILGKSCCDFICLDDTNHGGGGIKTGGPFGPVDITEVVPKIVIAAVTAMLSLSLLFFLIHRLRQKQIQGRINSAEARRSAQMCDECDDTRSLDYSMDYFERGTSQSIYPPHYLAWHWWKPPNSYIPPRGEAPPPYEEAIGCTSNFVPMVTTGVTGFNDRQNTTLTRQTGTTATTSLTNTTILTNENINPKLDGSLKTIVVGNNEHCVVNGGEDCVSALEPQPGPSTRLNETEDTGTTTEGTCSTNKENYKPKTQQASSDAIFTRSFVNSSIVPDYNDHSFQLHHGREYFRHSLTLPRRPDLFLERDFNVHCTEQAAGRNQRCSLQFNVVDWSSSSSTLSLSTPNSANGLDLGLPRPSSSSSSSSSSSNNTNKAL